MEGKNDENEDEDEKKSSHDTSLALASTLFVTSRSKTSATDWMIFTPPVVCLCVTCCRRIIVIVVVLLVFGRPRVVVLSRVVLSQSLCEYFLTSEKRKKAPKNLIDLRL